MKEAVETIYLLMLALIATPIFLGIVQMLSDAVKDNYAEKRRDKRGK